MAPGPDPQRKAGSDAVVSTALAPEPQPSQRRRRSQRRPLRPRLKHWLRQMGRMGYTMPAAFTGYLALKGLHPDLPGWPCPLRALTGIPCPTCFLTRATSQALVGHLEPSIRLHAFGPPLAVGLLVWSFSSWRAGTIRPWPKQAHWPLPASVGVAAALLVYWFARLSLEYGLGWPAFPR